MRNTRPEDLFRAEKERAMTSRNSQHARLLAEAKAAFDKLMAEGQAARKSGRPRKHPLPPLKTGSRAPSRPTAAPPAKAAVASPAAVAPAAKSAKSAPAAKPAAKAKAMKTRPAAKGGPTKPARAASSKKENGKSSKAKGKAKRR